MSRPPIHVCFYSNQCKWSKAFITELAPTPYKGDFKFVCVDPTPNRPPLPTWLKKVPTLVISGEPNPRTDSDVLNWLYEKKMKEDGSRSNKASGGGMILGSTPQGPAEPEPFGLGGADLFSDPYTFLDQDTTAQGNGGLQGSEKNFSFLAGSSSQGSREGSNMNTIEVVGKASKKEQMFDNQMKSYMSSRDAGIPQKVNRM